MIEHKGDVCPVAANEHVRVDLGEGHFEDGRAGMFNWGPGAGPNGEGRILRYALMRESVGDLASNAAGSGARFNAGKTPVELIPLELIAAYWERSRQRAPRTAAGPDWALALSLLGKFQMRPEAAIDARSLLHDAIYAINHDGKAWAECAEVFDYGRKKYAAWNWAKGMPWSVPIACAARHIIWGPLAGEPLDGDSKLTHRGHFMCNVVMLLWFIDHYREGDDRIAPVVPTCPVRFAGTKPVPVPSMAQAPAPW